MNTVVPEWRMGKEGSQLVEPGAESPTYGGVTNSLTNRGRTQGPGPGR